MEGVVHIIANCKIEKFNHSIFQLAIYSGFSELFRAIISAMTLLIKNAQIIDGTGGEPFKGDVLVKNDRISAIGSLGRQKAGKTIQAAGLYIAPGFIDCNTDSDHYLTLFANPEQQDFLLQGVTTIIGGLCGSSLAPLIYGSLESIRKWANPGLVNVNWHSVAEFLATISRRKLGVNFGTFIGHSTVRRALLGENLRDLTLGELQVFEKILSDALKEGAFGLSSGLGYIHGRGTPYSEMADLLKIVSRHGGLYATHLRSETNGLIESVKETLNLSREAGITSIINHLRPLKGYEAEYGECLDLISARVDESDLYFDVYPFESSHVTMYSLLPLWAQSSNLETMLSSIKNPSTRKKIVEELKRLNGADITIASAGANSFLVGKTVKEFAAGRGVSEAEALVLTMEMTGLKATVFHKDVDYPLAVKALAHNRSLVSSNTASFPAGSIISERRTTFIKFLDLIIKKNLIPLELGIKKITSKPAEIMKLSRRGLIREGYIADLVVFSADAGTGAEIQHVLVNGQPVVLNKNFNGSREGAVLRLEK